MFNLNIPPAVSVLAVTATVYGVLQGLKKIPVLTPYLTGWVAIAFNVLLSIGGLLITIPANQLYTTSTLIALLTTVLSAAGVHGTVSALSKPTVLAATPPTGEVKEVPATLVPNDPGNVPLASNKTILPLVLLALMIIPLMAAKGCSSFEKTTFQTLAATKAVLDGAQADYESGKLPHSEQVYKALNEAKAADTLAVNAMVVYEQIKATGATASQLEAQSLIVEQLLADLPALIASVKTFYVTTQSSLYKSCSSRQLTDTDWQYSCPV